MKIAFLLLNHRGPTQLTRLLNTLREQLPDSPIVVHHDAFHGELAPDLFEAIGNVHLLTSGKRLSWGDFSLAEVTCWSLTWMREHLEFDWVIMLSAQDYPIKPLAGLADDLARSGADAVFRATPINQLPTARRMLMRRRYLYQYRPAVPSRLHLLPGRVRDALRWSTWGLVQALNVVQPLFQIYRFPDRMPYRIGWRADKTPFDKTHPCWHGSQWFGMSRGALEHVLDFMADHPDYVDYYRNTVVPDESLIATLVFNSPQLRVANRDITYTRWSDPLPSHPDIFGKEDFAQLESMPEYFARKFDINKDSRILDLLDELIGTPVSS